MNLAIIQARMGSTRLPKKVLLKLAGKSILEHVVERVKRSQKIDEVIVATTIDKSDLELIAFCSAKNIRIFIGSEADVLDRYYQTARLFNPVNIIRVTSDCPLIDPEIIDLIINQHVTEKADYTSNTLVESYPDGLDAEVFTFGALTNAWNNAKLKSDREHVTPYLKKNPQHFKQISVENDLDLSGLRWTIDQQEDFNFLNEIFNGLYFINPEFNTNDILGFLEKNPKISSLNSGIIRNEGYLKSLMNDK